MIELNQSWAGPYHTPAEKVIKAGDLVAGGVAIASATVDPYPADVLAALQAKADRLDEVVSDMAAQVEALQRPAPPGYVAAKPTTSDVLKKYAREGVAATTKEGKIGCPSMYGMTLDDAIALGKPSLLDELAEVGFEAMFTDLSYNDQTPGRKRDWKAVALAVARRLLSKPVTEEDVRPCSNQIGDRAVVTAYNRAQLAELEAK